MSAGSKVDLHVHSTESDGSLSPEQLAEHAAVLGLRAIALTDHDAVTGVSRCIDASSKRGVLCLPGVELSSKDGETHIHILGYFIDTSDRGLGEALARFRADRVARVYEMLRRLDAAGFVVDRAEIDRQAAVASVGRGHVASALVKAGYAFDRRDAFKRFIGMSQPFYVESPRPTPPEAIGLIADARGVPVIAHAALSKAEHLIESLVACGLSGIEVYHGEHTPEQRERLAALAHRLGLLVTGGSDYHGPEGPSGEMGSSLVPEGVLEALVAARPGG